MGSSEAAEQESVEASVEVSPRSLISSSLIRRPQKLAWTFTCA